MSNDTKWTPGEWRVSDSYEYISVVMGTALENPYEYECLHVWQCDGVNWDERDEEAEANAHLIAAAPDLYDALADAESVLVDVAEISWLTHGGAQPCIDAARAALAKARGEQQ